MSRGMAAAAAAMMLGAALARADVVDLVVVGDAGNAADTRYDAAGVGRVADVFQIGRLEITNGQYREFLNAKASVGDAFSLYSTNMAGTFGGITRSGSGTVGDPWVYTAKDGDPAWNMRPANYVSFWDAARFCNWMHHGGGSGDTESGSYENVGDQANFARTPDATWVIPSGDEWYRAAYYKGGGAAAGYWDYATQGDVLPASVLPANDDGNAANWDFVAGGPYWSTPVGAYGLSVGPYGTLDQNGNLAEWVEDVTLNPSSRGVRGGSWGGNEDYGMHASELDALSPGFHFNTVGFRVALVPEPATVCWLALGWAMAARRPSFRKVAAGRPQGKAPNQ